MFVIAADLESPYAKTCPVTERAIFKKWGPIQITKKNILDLHIPNWESANSWMPPPDWKQIKREVSANICSAKWDDEWLKYEESHPNYQHNEE